MIRSNLIININNYFKLVVVVDDPNEFELAAVSELVVNRLGFWYFGSKWSISCLVCVKDSCVIEFDEDDADTELELELEVPASCCSPDSTSTKRLLARLFSIVVNSSMETTKNIQINKNTLINLLQHFTQKKIKISYSNRKFKKTIMGNYHNNKFNIKKTV